MSSWGWPPLHPFPLGRAPQKPNQPGTRRPAMVVGWIDNDSHLLVSLSLRSNLLAAAALRHYCWTFRDAPSGSHGMDQHPSGVTIKDSRDVCCLPPLSPPPPPPPSTHLRAHHALLSPDQSLGSSATRISHGDAHITTLFPQNTQAHNTVQQLASADSSGPEPRLPLLQQLCQVQLVDVGGNDEVILRQTTCSNNQHST